MGLLSNIFQRNSELENSIDLGMEIALSQRLQLKELALETCVGYIARAFSQSKIKFTKDGKVEKNQWDYILNIRPNSDQNASSFWQTFITTLIRENEVLAIVTDDNQILIADNFHRKEYAIFPDVFENVTVKDYTFKRSFQMNEVIYLTYNNLRLESFLGDLFADYGEMYGRMIESNQRSYQIRAKVGLETATSLDAKNKEKLQKVIDNIFNSIQKSSIALLPIIKGFSYEEVSNGTNKGASVEEIEKLKHSTVNTVAEILGIPVALVHGEIADLEKNIKSFIKFCLNPLIKKVCDELNAKLLSKDDYLNGQEIVIFGLHANDLMELATSIDKLVSSGVFTRNEVRKKVGENEVENSDLDNFVITKNYETVDKTTKGGEQL